MLATKEPNPTDYVECLNWRNLHLRLNQNAERKLREVMGITASYVDPQAEEAARRHPNPLIRQAFQQWQETERNFHAATELLEAATELRQNQQLNAIFHGLEC